MPAVKTLNLPNLITCYLNLFSRQPVDEVLDAMLRSVLQLGGTIGIWYLAFRGTNTSSGFLENFNVAFIMWKVFY